MYSYSNSYLDNFRNHIKTTGVSESSPASASVQQNENTSAKETELSSITPDYNVSVPIGYAKLGIEKLPNGQEIHCYRLNNGQRVFIAPKESTKVVLNTYVNTGALNEKDDERGISHFCEHMAFNGTKGTNGYMRLGKGDVFRMVADMGGYTNASTNFAETNYTISIPQFKKDDFETIVKMQSSMMNNLEMSQEMTEKEHGPVTSEINMYSDIPETLAMNAAIKNLYNIKTTSDDIVAGRVDNILNVDSKKVAEYYKNNYFPANMSTVVTGDINPDEAIEIISKHFKGENPVKPDRKLEPLNLTDKPVRKDILSPKAVATSGVLCFEGPANNDPKGNIELFAINYLLFNKKHSKVNDALEKYNVEVQANSEKLRTEPGDKELLTLNYNTTEENSELTLKSIYDNIANFKAPTAEEMETLKSGLKMKYEKRYEDTESLNYMIGQNSLNGNIKECTDALKLIDNLTSQDLVNAVHKYYDLNRVSIAIVHPQKTETAILSNNHLQAKNISFTGTHTKENVKKPFKTENIIRYKLNNNCEVALTNSNNDIAAYSAYITNQIPANTKPGVINILQEILIKGTTQTVKTIDKNNITAYSGASNNDMYYEAELPAKNISTSLKIMKQALLNPDFSQETFDLAKKAVITDLMTQQPNAFDNVKKELFSGTPKGHTRKQILENIDNVTLSDVIGLHQYILNNGGMTFAASIPMEKYPAIKDVINNELSEIRQMKETKPRTFNDYIDNTTTKVVKDEASTAQADIVEVFKFPTNKSPKDLAAYSIMNSILSRGEDTGLFNNLREKEKLAYSVYSDFMPSAEKTGLLICNIYTTTDSADLKSYDNVQRSINGFNTQINKMVNGEFTDSEFEAAKLGFKRQLLDTAELQTDKVARMSEGLNSVNGIESINNQYLAIDTLTREDIIRAAKEVFANKPIYSIRASKDTLNANSDFFKELEK